METRGKRRGTGIHAIVYAGKDDPLGRRLSMVISAHLATCEVETFQTIATLAHRLRGPLPDVLVIILAADGKDLREILGLRGLLEDRRILLILPDDLPESLAMGHTLRPRFLTCRGRGLRDVSSVLDRMIALYCRTPAALAAGTVRQ